MQIRILYRVGQFWRSVFLNSDTLGLEQAKEKLTPDQWALFVQLQPAEKNHAVKMLCKLLEQGEDQPDLFVATLLHDVGKLRYRLSPMERAMIVLVKAINPGQALRWGTLPPESWDNLSGWRKAFILAEQHARWGAELAHQAGASPLATSLIQQHHRAFAPQEGEAFNCLLHKLWLVDNES